jgi:carbon-monoxide dehydrogenase medium subunit
VAGDPISEGRRVVIPPKFDYEVAESVEHATELLGQYGSDAKLLAGGQSLLPLMKLRFAAPTVVIDIGRLEDLAYVREDGEHLAIGALTRYADLERDQTLERSCPLLAAACGEVGDPQVRHLGTIGGACAHGDPASDVPTVLVALDAELVVNGNRTVGARDFFQGVFTTALGPQDVLTEIRVPKTSAGWSYEKFHPRAQDWAIVGVAAVVERSNGNVGSARIALTNMGPTPIRATAVEEALAGGADVATAAQSATEGTEPIDDPFATAEYRRHLAPILVRRAIEEALS